VGGMQYEVIHPGFLLARRPCAAVWAASSVRSDCLSNRSSI
jgi:hypothetical protein